MVGIDPALGAARREVLDLDPDGPSVRSCFIDDTLPRLSPDKALPKFLPSASGSRSGRWLIPEPREPIPALHTTCATVHRVRRKVN